MNIYRDGNCMDKSQTTFRYGVCSSISQSGVAARVAFSNTKPVFTEVKLKVTTSGQHVCEAINHSSGVIRDLERLLQMLRSISTLPGIWTTRGREQSRHQTGRCSDATCRASSSASRMKPRVSDSNPAKGAETEYNYIASSNH